MDEKRSSSGRPPRKGHSGREFLLKAITEVVGEAELDKGYVLPARVNIEGVGGHFERWIGKDWWVKDGETISDTLRHQKKPLPQINQDIKNCNAERLELFIEKERSGDVSFSPAPGGTSPGIKPVVPNPDDLLKTFLYRKRSKLFHILWELAEGIAVEKVDKKTGRTTVYTQPPDKECVLYLMDHLVGKPKTKSKSISDLQEEEKHVSTMNVSDVR